MYFYIDESGNTGKDLMNENQTIFYYGMVVSPVDLENSRAYFVEEVKKCTNKEIIHGKDLSGETLTELIGVVSNFMDENKLKFHSYLYVKKDHIIIQFFDQLFGLNPFNNEHPKCDLYDQLQDFKTKVVLLYLLKESMEDSQLADILTARHHRNDSKGNEIIITLCNCLIEKLEGKFKQKEYEIFQIYLELLMKFLGKIIEQINNMSFSIGKDTVAKANILISHNLLAPILFNIKNHYNQDKCVKIYCEESGNSDESREVFIQTVETIMTSLDLILPSASPNITFVPKSNVGTQIVDLCLWVLQRKINNKEASEEVKNFYSNFIAQDNNTYLISINSMLFSSARDIYDSLCAQGTNLDWYK